MATRLLVVDDDDLVRNVMADTLRDFDFDVLEAADAEEAMSKLAEPDHIDLVLTDVRMPGAKDGLDLALDVRARHGALPLIILTGYAGDVRGRLTRIGQPFRFFQKPYRSQEVLGAIDELLGRRIAP